MNTLYYTIFYSGFLYSFEKMINEPKSYNHLTLNDRKNISKYYKLGYSYSEIGARIGKDKSTVCRELKRNSTLRKSFHGHKYKYHYAAITAHKKASKRLTKGKISPKLEQFRIYLGEQIQLKQTFEDFYYQIKNDMTYQFVKIPSIKTMYNWYHGKKISFKQTNVYKTKTYNKHPKDTRTSYKSIHDREIVLNDYETRGHYEIDLVLSGGKNKGGVLTFNHRATMKYYVAKVEDKRAETINRVLRGLIEEIGSDYIYSITSDNGSEFSYTEVIENMYNLNWYKADPYCSGQRGQNERLNRDLRVYYPKGTNFSNISIVDLKKTETLINKKHRRKFDGLSANSKELYCY